MSAGNGGGALRVLAVEKTRQVGHIAMNILDRGIRPHVVRLQKAVQFIAGFETRHGAQLRLGNVVLLEFLKRKALKGAARQITGSRMKRLRQFVRNLKGQFHFRLL